MKNIFSKSRFVENIYQLIVQEKFMSNTKILGIPNLIGAFDKFGNPVENTTRLAAKAIASRVDTYYKHWNKPEDNKSILSFSVPFLGNFGLGKWIALFETVTALALKFLQKSPATLTNLLTTLSEFGQTIIAGEDSDKESSLMAGCISVAGGVGLYSWLKETSNTLKGKDSSLKELSLFSKILLTIGSVVSSVMMAIGYAEKSSLAPIAKVDNSGKKAESMKLNGNSDMRCSIEWALMTVFPWLAHIKPVKLILDLALPLGALQDGVGHFVEALWNEKNKAKFENIFGSTATKIVKKIFGLEKKEISIPGIFNKKWYFGNREGAGVRAMLLPFFRAFGCEPPVCYLNDKENLVAKFPETASIKPKEAQIQELAFPKNIRLPQAELPKINVAIPS